MWKIPTDFLSLIYINCMHPLCTFETISNSGENLNTGTPYRRYALNKTRIEFDV